MVFLFFFFLFLINFYLLSLFRPYFFIVKKTKERGCCNPVGGIKEFFPFFFFKFYLQRNQIVCTKRITVVLIIILWNKKIWIEEISIFRTKFVYSFLITDFYLLFIDIEFVFFPLFFYDTEKFDSSEKRTRSTQDHVGHDEGCSTCSNFI